MPRRTLLTALFLLLGLAVQAGAAGRVVGKVADKRKDLFGQGPEEEPRRPLAISTAVKELMLLQTGALSAALLAIGERAGAVGMGPESTLRLNSGVIDVATGAAEDLDFFTQVGQFRFVFVPKPRSRKADKVLGLAPRHIEIRTPKAVLTLYGTDVYLTVAPNGDTAVYVAEGAVAVAAGGSEVRVGAGQWTQVAEDRPPTPPVSFRSKDGAPGASGGIEESASSDPFLHLLGLRPILDLPR